MNCLFCKIVAGEVSSEKVYETETILAFEDINPVAPVHTLIVPKQHIKSTNELTEENIGVIVEMFTAAKEIARQKGIADSGYRLVVNTGAEGGQVIEHLHLHLIGGRKLPPRMA